MTVVSTEGHQSKTSQALGKLHRWHSLKRSWYEQWLQSVETRHVDFQIHFLPSKEWKVLRHSDVPFWIRSHAHFPRNKAIYPEFWRRATHDNFFTVWKLLVQFFRVILRTKYAVWFIDKAVKLKLRSSEVVISARSSWRIFNVSWLNSRRRTGSSRKNSARIRF